jgi:hypothetical protein
MDMESYWSDLFRNILFSGLMANLTKKFKRMHSNICTFVSAVALSLIGLAVN